MNSQTQLQKLVYCRSNREDMGNWSELPEDLMSDIARWLEAPTDRARFSVVCRKWSYLAKSENNYLPPDPPWLMMTEKPDSDDRDFIGADGKSFALKLPKSREIRCIGSSGFWLAVMDMACDLCILNPFSGSKMDLPSLHSLLCNYDYEVDEAFVRFHKVIFSFPKSPKDDDFIAIVIYEEFNLAYMKKGAQLWQAIESNDDAFVDVIFYQDKFYAVNWDGIVWELNVNCSPDEKPNIVPISDPLEGPTVFNQRYLVEFQGMLLQVINLDDSSYRSESINKNWLHVFKLNFSTGGWVKLNDLGQHSFFLGYNNGVSLLAASNSPFKPNCIYFTADEYAKIQIDDKLSYKSDVGVFNLANSIFSPYSEGLYSSPGLTHPVWIIPASLSKNQ